MSKESVLAKLRSDVATFGWHCLSVSPRQGEDGARFTYTIGLAESFSHAEIMIFGLGNKVSHEILTDCVAMIKAGATFESEMEYPNVIGGNFKVAFKGVKESCLPEYFGAAVRYYDGKPFSGLILFWPDKNHQFPWQESDSQLQREAMNIVQLCVPADGPAPRARD